MTTTAFEAKVFRPCALLDPVQLLTKPQRIAYWRHYEEWTLNASDEELAQLQLALEEHDTLDVQSLVQLMRVVAMDVTASAKFPASFLRPFRDPTWMRTQAH